LKTGTTVARSGMWALTRTAPGRIDLRPKPPSSCSSASQDAPKKPSASSPVSLLVPPGQSATGPPTGLMPPIGS
jgi:hypothetical protein